MTRHSSPNHSGQDAITTGQQRNHHNSNSPQQQQTTTTTAVGRQFNNKQQEGDIMPRNSRTATTTATATGRATAAHDKKTTEQQQNPTTLTTADHNSLTNNEQTVLTKRHRNRPDLAKFGEENTEPGDNARYLRMARVSLSLPPIDISDPKQVEQRINDYFDYCEQNDRKPNMIGMANWLGVDRKTVQMWKAGDYREKTHFPVIKKAVDLLEELWVDYMQNGKMNPASGIFLAKNMFQYKDVQDVVVTPNAPFQSGDTDNVRQIVDALPDPDDT